MQLLKHLEAVHAGHFDVAEYQVRRFLLDQWWVATMPGIAIFVVSLGFNLLGDGLRDVIDHKRD